MNKKVSFTQHQAYLTKVKKEKPVKAANHVKDVVQEQRHVKINFKQYLRDIEEQTSDSDEYTDVPHISITAAVIREHRDEEDLLEERNHVIDFGHMFGSDTDELVMSEETWAEVSHLELDESVTIRDTNSDLWYVTRTPSNYLVIESQEFDLTGKLRFNELVKKFKC